MSLEINYNQLLSKFNDLATKGLIHYTPPKTVQLSENGFTFEFQISPSLLTKPQSEDALRVLEETHKDDIPTRPVCFGPGSDIANGHPDLLVTTVNNAHLLVINKFCVFSPQLLLLTTDSYRRQHEPLGLEDLKAAWAVLHTLESPHYVIYNCTPEAGASRKHKHMQVLPRPECGSGFCLFPDSTSFSPQNMPFRCFMHHLQSVDQEKPTSRTLLKTYTHLLAQTRTALNLPPGDCSAICSHNVVLTKEWMLLIPRRSNNFNGVTANAAGMVGSVWLISESQLEQWKALGLTNVVSQLGVPAKRT